MIGGNDGTAVFVVLMFLVTLGGIFIVSALIGVLTAGLNGRIEELRKGRAPVIARDHTVILGWSDQVFIVVSELVKANRGAGGRRSSSWPTRTRSRWRTRSGPGSASWAGPG